MWLGSYSWTVMKRWSPLHGMYGSVEVEFEVQRTIKRAELMAFVCLVKQESHDLTERGILVEVEHVKAHRTKKRNICRSLRGLSPKATRRLMGWQKQEQCWTKG